MLRQNPFFEPCLPTLAKEPPAGPGWVHEVKFDGYCLQVHKEGKDVVLLSKNGNDLACANDGTPDFASLLHKRDVPLCIWVFDILALNGKDLRTLKLFVRRQKLNKLMARFSTPTIQCSVDLWEHKKIALNQLSPKTAELDVLNDAGDDGWELVAILTNAFSYC